MWYHPSHESHPSIHSHGLAAAFRDLTIQALNAPRLAEPTFTVHIHGLDLYHPPKISWGHEDQFYVDVDVDGEVQTTATLAKHELPWKDRLKFEARKSSFITLRVFSHRMLHGDMHVGSIEGRLDSLLSVTEKANIIVRELPPLHGSSHTDDATKTRITFSVKHDELREPHSSSSTQGERSENSKSQTTTVEKPKVTMERSLGISQPNSEATMPRSSKREFVAGAVTTMFSVLPNDNQIQQIVDSANTFSPLLDKLQIFLSLTDTLGDIHPYVKMATFILAGTVKLFTSQMFFANSIKNLVEAMTAAHSFLDEANTLSIISSHLEIITALSTQTVECSYFIRDVTKTAGLARVANQLFMSNVEQKVQGYVQRFQELKGSLHQLASITTAITVLRLYDEVQGISTQISLDAMYYAEDVHYTSVEEPGTLEPDQLQLVDEISDWINGDSTERIYFLCGPAECGKTSVARRVAHIFDRLQRLGSSYFVQEPVHPHESHHNHPRYPCSIFRTISRDIADHNPHFRRAVGEMVNKRAIRSTSNICSQFENFILYPAQRMSATGPVVIVIDALDYCGNKTSRAPLLAMLANRAAQLPPNFRILVTSRPAADVVGAFKDKEHVVMKVLEDTTLPDDDSGISFSPLEKCEKLSISYSRHGSQDTFDPSEEENLSEGYEAYGTLHDHSYVGHSDQCTDVTLPFPSHHAEGPIQAPPDELIPCTRKQEVDVNEPPYVLHGNMLSRTRTLHGSDTRRRLKPTVTTVRTVGHSLYDGPPEYTLYPEEAEMRSYEERGVANSSFKDQSVSVQRVKSDRHPRRTSGRDFYPPHPAHRSRMIVSREAYYIQ